MHKGVREEEEASGKGRHLVIDGPGSKRAA